MAHEIKANEKVLGNRRAQDPTYEKKYDEFLIF